MLPFSTRGLYRTSWLFLNPMPDSGPNFWRKQKLSGKVGTKIEPKTTYFASDNHFLTVTDLTVIT